MNNSIQDLKRNRDVAFYKALRKSVKRQMQDNEKRLGEKLFNTDWAVQDAIEDDAYIEAEIKLAEKQIAMMADQVGEEIEQEQAEMNLHRMDQAQLLAESYGGLV